MVWASLFEASMSMERDFSPVVTVSPIDIRKSCVDVRSVRVAVRAQVDMCRLNDIKYDFVGRFEELEADAKVVMDRFGAPPLNAFSLGKALRQTNSSDKILRHYDTKELHGKVKNMYGMDLAFPLNKIVYDAPDAIRELYENGGSGG